MFYSPATEELTREGDVGVRITKYSLAGRMRSITCTIPQWQLAVVISSVNTCKQVVFTASYIDCYLQNVTRMPQILSSNASLSPPLSRP
jgi:hypothetical protein